MSGVVGLYNVTNPVTKTVYSLYSLQHRGQEACGLFVSNEKRIVGHRDAGLVRNVLTDSAVAPLAAENPLHAIGQVRASTHGIEAGRDAEPRYFRHLRAEFAVAGSGGLVNSEELFRELQEDGAIFQSTSKVEILAHLVVHNAGRFVPALSESLRRLEGGFVFLILRRDKMYAARDPHGMEPLCLGRLDDGGWMVASESCALELMGATFVRDIAPGEILEISRTGLTSHRYAPTEARRAHNLMEYVYTARVDSVIDGVNVYHSRFQAGVELARESFVDSDIVVGVPDSSLAHGAGYAAESGIPSGYGLVKNKYSGRSFIEPTQAERARAVYLKLAPVKYLLEGKRVTLVDDSIVRGTTSKQLIKVVRDAGATEVHMRIASPRMIAPSFYGMDTESYEELIAASHTTEQIREYIGADSLAFLSIEGLRTAVGLGEGVLDAPWTGNYPTDLYSHTAAVEEGAARSRAILGDPRSA